MADPIRWQDAWWHQQPDGSWLRFNDQSQQWEYVPVTPVYVPSAGMSTGAKWAIGLGIGAAVLVILMILAAIAIPVFLRQREKGWTAQAEQALKNAAVTQEMHYTNESEYSSSIDDLVAQGLEIPATVNLTIPEASAQGYCIEATHDEIPGEVWSYDSDSFRPREGPCL